MIFAWKGKHWPEIKSRGVLKMVCDDDVSILFRHTIKNNIFMISKILFLIINFFKVCPFFNKWLNKWLFTDEKTKENKSVANYIPTKCLNFASRCLESSLTQSIKCTYRELRSVLGFFQEISWCAKGGQMQHLF